MIFITIVVAVVVLMALGVLYGVLTDPARIDEEEDQEVVRESPEERHGFLRSNRRLSNQDSADRMSEQSKSGSSENEVNDL
ncbi:MAG: hypothetical protein AAB964_02495 [Patescibacteria group bacterium]